MYISKYIIMMYYVLSLKFLVLVRNQFPNLTHCYSCQLQE